MSRFLTLLILLSLLAIFFPVSASPAASLIVINRD